VKRKNITPAPEPVPVPQAEGSGFSVKDGVFVCLYTALLFLAMTVQTGRMAVVLPAVALALVIGRGPVRRMRERFSVPVLGFLGFALMYGCASVYSSFGSYAVSEFYKFAASFSVAAVLLLRFDRKHVRALLWGLCVVCSVLALVCVDMGSWRVLFGAFNGLMGQFGMDFSSALINSTKGRLNGLYNDANITGALLGPVILLGTHLLHTSEKRWQKAAASLCTGICSVSFLACMSRGAILTFGLAALIYLLAERRDRLGLFFDLFCVGISMLGAGGLAMARMVEGSPFPDFMCLLCGVMIFALEWGVASNLSHLLRGREKFVLGGCAVLAVLICAVGLAAWNLTEPYVFTDSGRFTRTAVLPGGDYTLSGDWEGTGELTLLVTSRTPQESLMRGSTELYNGPMDGASFTVPDDVYKVYFTFSGAAGAVVRDVRLSNGYTIPLKYTLLPEMVAGRLHEGLLGSYSFLMRLQYVKDGLRLFQRSPLIGFGLGSSEGWLTSLQPFFYESLFLHNHILQVMCDMGLVGLVFWLLFLGGVVWLLVRRVLKEKDSLAAVLLSCWVMMVVHGLMEIDFSIRAFQCEAWLLLLIPVLLYAQPLPWGKAVRWGGVAASLLVCVYLVVFAGLLELHRMVLREMASFSPASASEFMDTTKRWIRMDVFDHEQSQLNFVGNAAMLNDSRYNRELRLYSEELRKSGTYTACSGLAGYYYLPRGEYEEMFACSREGVAQEASVSDAWNQQFDFYRTEVLPLMEADDMEVFVRGVLDLRDFLTAHSEGRLEEIQLTEENQEFIRQVEQVEAAEMNGTGALLFLTVFGGTAGVTE